ncbi:DUF1134 domain-containing protein [Altererythrobacter litoralis]|uniref:DUF1134 domain-containing protein n=1 Tax=Altererythrobacter litoralis TaxID=3113904 RepID=A0ABU7GCR8_9SPHN|nr:DUF1134 domain-containing protein [Erythrobacteraceae bacterium 1XM1-14]
MKKTLTGYFKQIGIALAAGFALAAAPSVAQELQSIDPDNAYDAPIDGDLAAPQTQTQTQTQAQAPAVPADQTGNDLVAFGSTEPQEPQQLPPADGPADAAAPAEETATAAQGSETTYGEDDLIGAAEGVFGKGAEGLAKVIEDLLSKQGEPNAYIVGREAGGAFAIGVRYGSGTLHHKVEGNRPVYWTGPSIGFDAGANAANTFVLVYNLYDSEELYERFPAGEGQAYLVGGLHVSYMRKGDVVLIPIRVGAGLRLGINAGYMKFSKKQRWLPF